MFAKVDEPDAASIVFVARENYVLRDVSEFSREMTLFGKVQEKIPRESSVDLLDLLKVLPPTFAKLTALPINLKRQCGILWMLGQKRLVGL